MQPDDCAAYFARAPRTTRPSRARNRYVIEEAIEFEVDIAARIRSGFAVEQVREQPIRIGTLRPADRQEVDRAIDELRIPVAHRNRLYIDLEPDRLELLLRKLADLLIELHRLH